MPKLIVCLMALLVAAMLPIERVNACDSWVLWQANVLKGKVWWSITDAFTSFSKCKNSANKLVDDRFKSYQSVKTAKLDKRELNSGWKLTGIQAGQSVDEAIICLPPGITPNQKNLVKL